MTVRLLTRVQAATSIVEADFAPVYVGGGPGEDWTCPGCQTVLATSMRPGAMWEVAVRCRGCGDLAAFPDLPPGHPTGIRVVAPPGTMRPHGPFSVDETVTIVTDRGHRQRQAETGLGLFIGRTSAHLTLDQNLGISLIQRMRAVIGDRTYDRIVTRDRRARRSRTQPSVRHRVATWVSGIEDAAAVSRLGTPWVDPGALAGLHMTTTLFEAWGDNPSWPNLAGGLVDANMFDHEVINLGAASLLADWGNDVTLSTGGHGQRRADVLMHPGAGQVGRVEAKVPSRLKGPRAAALTGREAEVVVERAVDDAGLSAGGQLPPDAAAMLAIGSFYLADDELDELQRAATSYVEDHLSGKPHFLGIAVLSLGAVLDGPGGVVVPGARFAGPGARLAAGFNVRFASNAAYSSVTAMAATEEQARAARMTEWADEDTASEAFETP